MNTFSFSQKRFGISYSVSYTKPSVYDFPGYSKHLYSKYSSNPNSSKVFYKDLLDYRGRWDFAGFGCWVLALNKKRFNFYVTAGITAMGYHSFYDAGLSDVYPYIEFRPLPSGRQLYMYKDVSLHFFTLGLKGEFRVNKNINVEITPSYCLKSGAQNKFIFTKYNYTTSWNTAWVGGEHVYPDVNSNGIINVHAGFNLNVTDNLKFHLLYMQNITGASDGDKDDTFRFRYRYNGISLQLSYNFLNPDKRGND
jgi:hypothetical protein